MRSFPYAAPDGADNYLDWVLQRRPKLWVRSLTSSSLNKKIKFVYIEQCNIVLSKSLKLFKHLMSPTRVIKGEIFIKGSNLNALTRISANALTSHFDVFKTTWAYFLGLLLIPLLWAIGVSLRPYLIKLMLDTLQISH